ncbi:MAG: FHA domain-containing protein [Dehalococcoidia bacterium]|nr:FHA domain-containing protein [Dehalococcoidia bacterium]
MVLDHRTVSRRHARISWNGLTYVVEDLGSKNGTWVNDRRPFRGRGVPLR